MTDDNTIETGMIIGVDVGGTFTDVVALNRHTGEIRIVKRPTTADDPSVGVIAALKDLGWPWRRQR